MTGSEPTVRFATPEEIPEVAEILNSTFESFASRELSEGTLGYTRWMLESHGSAEGLVRLVLVDGKIVGVNANRRRTARVWGRDLRASGQGYGAVLPSARGQGLFRALLSANEGRPDFGVQISQVPQVQHIHRGRSSVPVANPWTVFVFVQRPLQAARDRSEGGWLPNVVGYAWLATRGRLRRRRSRAVEGGWVISAVDRCDGRFDELYERTAGSFDFILQRDHEFLNWRYLDRRAGSFAILAAEAGDQLLGYAAVSVAAGRGHIADLLALPERGDVARSLVEAALDHCAGLGSSAVECAMMLHHPYTAVLRDAGFVRIPGRSTNLASRLVLTPRLVDVGVLQTFGEDERARIHLTLGDTELA